MTTEQMLLSAVLMFIITGFNGDSSAADGENLMTPPKHFLVKLLGTRPTWPDDMTPAEEKIMGEHFIYLKDLVAKRKVITAGPCFSNPAFGLIILQVESDSEAVEIMKKEPSIVAGLHTYEMQPMVLSLLVSHWPRDRYVTEPSDKIVRKEVVVPGSLDDVWTAWTTTEGIKGFFSQGAKVELRVGGPFEIYFNMSAPEGERGSENCRILSYLPKEMLSYEWNAPPSFGPLRDIYTRVILQFAPVGSDSVKVTLSHVGWGQGEEWDKLYAYFDRAWEFVLNNFKTRMVSGPIDWSKE